MIEAFQYINKAFESKVRLGIMAILMVNEEADFNMRFESFSALRGCLKNSPCLSSDKTIKVVIIGLLILLLMIPMFMIENLISERGRTQEEAIDEVSEKWSLAQTITGPYLNLQYPVVTESVHKPVVF